MPQVTPRGRRTRLPRARINHSISALGAPPAVTPVAPVPALVPPPGVRAPPPPAPVHNDSAGLGVGNSQHGRDGVGCRGRQAEDRERLPARHPLGFDLIFVRHFNLRSSGKASPAGSAPMFQRCSKGLYAKGASL